MIAGGASPDRMQGGAARIAELVPGARSVTMPGQDHGSVLQEPADLAASLREFLA